MKLVYRAVNQVVLEKVPANAKNIIDIGCGNGALAKEIKRRQTCFITGVTYSEEEASIASDVLDRVFVCDLNVEPLPSLGDVDLIICSHVLEHLSYPDMFLKRLRLQISQPHQIIVALPNVLAWRQRLRFLLGRFEYQESGIMDRTHLRFFDRTTARDLVVSAGYRIVSFEDEGVMPCSRFLPFCRNALDRLATMVAPGLTAQQFVIEGESSD